jgi:predicted nucleotidyltransferase
MFYDDIQEWDLKELINNFLTIVPSTTQIHLFGSRAYQTGSLRSDIDILVSSSSPLLYPEITRWIKALFPCVDIFENLNNKIARSLINGSHLDSGDKSLTEKLNAILLWSDPPKDFNEDFTDWTQKTLRHADFRMTMLPNVDVIGDSFNSLFSGITDFNEKDYINEAIASARITHYRSSVVLGWCAVIHRFQQKIHSIGFPAFNNASTTIKNQTSGKFKRWNKEFNISTLAELQSVFDTDIIIIFEGMGLIDSNQSQRLETCFKLRCQSAHPGNAVISVHNVISFFSDIDSIVLSNASFRI